MKKNKIINSLFATMVITSFALTAAGCNKNNNLTLEKAFTNTGTEISKELGKVQESDKVFKKINEITKDSNTITAIIDGESLLPKSTIKLTNDTKSKNYIMNFDIFGKSDINMFFGEDTGLLNFNGSKTYSFPTNQLITYIATWFNYESILSDPYIKDYANMDFSYDLFTNNNSNKDDIKAAYKPITDKYKADVLQLFNSDGNKIVTTTTKTMVNSKNIDTVTFQTTAKLVDLINVSKNYYTDIVTATYKINNPNIDANMLIKNFETSIDSYMDTSGLTDDDIVSIDFTTFNGVIRDITIYNTDPNTDDGKVSFTFSYDTNMLSTIDVSLINEGETEPVKFLTLTNDFFTGKAINMNAIFTNPDDTDDISTFDFKLDLTKDTDNMSLGLTNSKEDANVTLSGNYGIVKDIPTIMFNKITSGALTISGNYGLTFEKYDGNSIEIPKADSNLFDEDVSTFVNNELESLMKFQEVYSVLSNLSGF